MYFLIKSNFMDIIYNKFMQFLEFIFSLMKI